jgi:hypothetical protein
MSMAFGCCILGNRCLPLHLTICYTKFARSAIWHSNEVSTMRGDHDWDVIPHDKAECVIFGIALAVVLGAAWWIFRYPVTPAQSTCLRHLNLPLLRIK